MENAKGMVGCMKAKNISTSKGINVLIAFALALFVLLMMPTLAFAATGTKDDPIPLQVGKTTKLSAETEAYLSFTPPKDGVYTLDGLGWAATQPEESDVEIVYPSAFLHGGFTYLFKTYATYTGWEIQVLEKGRLYKDPGNYSGQQYLIWDFDPKSGTLTIENGVGEGKMASCGEDLYPWDNLEAQIKHVIIGEGVTTIGDDAFSGMLVSTSNAVPEYGALESVSIPSTLKSIGRYCFWSCGALKTVSSFPASLESVGWDAFANNPVLDNVTFEGPTAFDFGAFENCPALENVTVKDSNMTEFGTHAFRNTAWVRNLAAKNKGAAVVNGVLIGAYEAYDKKPGDGILVIPDGVTKIAPYAVSGTTTAPAGGEEGTQVDWSLVEVVIPDSVTEIGESAFLGCTDLERVTFGDGVTDIPDGCFEGDYEMRTVNFGTNVKTIGDRAFQDNWLPGDLVIPDTVVSIGKQAFQNDTVALGASWVGVFGELRPKDLADRHITMGAALTEIGSQAFDGWTDGWDPTTVTIHAYDGTYAQEWAGEQGFEFESRGAAPSAAWTRLAGNSALDTMSAIVDAGEFAKGGTVVLASLEGYWDALTAAGIAGLEKAPVLMVLQDSVSSQTTAQLKKLAPKKIIVCGGTYWIPDKVVNAAKAAAGTNPEVVRLAGANAAITAEKIAAAGTGKWSDTAIVATAGTFQDALAAAPVAYANKMPIFLAQYDFNAEQGYITQETIKAMQAAGIEKCYIAGGTYWLPPEVKTNLEGWGITVLSQLGGETAVETSGKIANLATSKLGMSAEGMGAANVAQHYDALASAAFCGKNGSVLVLVRDPQSSVISGFVKDHKAGMTKGYVFGGTGSVSDASMKALQTATK